MYVYILACADATYYTGITQNFEVRHKQHLQGRARYTRDNPPIFTSIIFEVPTRKIAARIERKIKNVGAYQFIVRSCNLIQFESISGKVILKGSISQAQIDFLVNICSK